MGRPQVGYQRTLRTLTILELSGRCAAWGGRSLLWRILDAMRLDPSRESSYRGCDDTW